MGGLGLRSAPRMAQAAYWTSRADVLSMLDQRLPEVTAQISNSLSQNVPAAGGCQCIGITTDLFVGQVQRSGVSISGRQLYWPINVPLRGPICVHIPCPTAPEFKLRLALFRTVVLGRLRLPLQVTEARCEYRSACPSQPKRRWRECAVKQMQRQIATHEHQNVSTTEERDPLKIWHLGCQIQCATVDIITWRGTRRGANWGLSQGR